MKIARNLLLATCIALAIPNPVIAGWEVQSRNTEIKSNGERQTPQATIMRIGKNQVRLEQPTSITLMDYNKQRFTVMNPQSASFWSGTVDEYVAEIVRSRKARAEERFGADAAVSFGRSAVNESKLPTIVLRKLGSGDTIAGHATVKYLIESNGEQFQELWVAEDLNISADLDPKKYLAYQQKMSGMMLGKSADSLNAAYRNPDVRKLYDNGYILQSITRHIGGGFERSVTSVRQIDVSDADFQVPETYRRVRLSDVFASEAEKG